MRSYKCETQQIQYKEKKQRNNHVQNILRLLMVELSFHHKSNKAWLLVIIWYIWVASQFTKQIGLFP